MCQNLKLTTKLCCKGHINCFYAGAGKVKLNLAYFFRQIIIHR